MKRGIVVTAANQHLPGLRIALWRACLLGSSLPIEVWVEPGVEHFGDWPEKTSFFVFQNEIIVGFARKIEAILNSRFDEVLFFDADVWFTINPDTFFDSLAYRHLRYLLWPDLPGLNCCGWPATDSGVMLWDKTVHSEVLVRALDITLNHHAGDAEGDKESYALALGHSASHAACVPKFIGFEECSNGASMVRGCAMLQSFENNHAFCHSTLFKFGLNKKLHSSPTWQWAFSAETKWDHEFSELYTRWFPSLERKYCERLEILDFDLKIL